MTAAYPANLELAIVLPLGVIAQQLMKVEVDLRLLSIRASAYARGEHCAAREVALNIEKIHETLDTIHGLLSIVEADFQPRSVGSPARRKPNPERDD